MEEKTIRWTKLSAIVSGSVPKWGILRGCHSTARWAIFQGSAERRRCKRSHLLLQTHGPYFTAGSGHQQVWIVTDDGVPNLVLEGAS